MPHQISARHRLRDDSDDEDQESENDYRGNDQLGEYTNGVNKSAFQPGSIVRVSLTDFVTYSAADFFPGPSLNMVIGPNGTGKSTFVSAICIGLGWRPSVLGRADKFEEFVARGKDRAIVEIELKGKSDRHANHVVKVMISEGGQRKWWLNGKDSTLAKVQQLMLSLSIQIDNLCQFLPQDKVSEFSAMDPKEKLHSTQRAAAPPQMLEWHDQLIDFRKKQKKLQLAHDTDQASLQSNREKRDALQDDVNKLEDLAKARKQIELFKKAAPFIEYKARRDEHAALKGQKKEALANLKRLQRRVEPIMQAINDKQAYQREIQAVEKERLLLVQKTERSVTAIVKDMETADNKIKEIDNAREGERAVEVKRKQEIAKNQREINELTARKQHVVDFDASEWNRRVREEDKAIRELGTKKAEIKDQQDALKTEAQRTRADMKRKEDQLDALASQAGQQLNRLRNASADAAKLYEWIQDHQDQFEQTVYGPPLLECRIKPGCEQYLDAVEAALNREVILSFVTQNRNDYLKLGAVMRQELGLSEIWIKTSNQPLASFKSPVNEEMMRSFGLDGFSLDFVEGPDPVLAMLCGASKLHLTGIALRDISEDQLRRLSHPSSSINNFVVGETSYRITRRLEYGPEAVSTSAQNFGPARWWNAHTADTSATQELQAKLEEYQTEFATLQRKNNDFKKSLVGIETQIAEREDLKKKLLSDKADLQKAYNEYKNLPNLIEMKENALQKRLDAGKMVQEKRRNALFEKTQLVLKKAALAFEYREKFAQLQKCHQKVLEAQIWLIEATSDFEALTEENVEVTAQVIESRTLVERLTNETEEKKRKAKRLATTCQEIIDGVDPDGEDKKYLDWIGGDDGMKLEELKAKTDAEQAFIDAHLTNNPNAQIDYDKFSKAVSRLEAQLEGSTTQLKTLAVQINEVKQNWEPALDELVATISDAFSYNFAQIGCAGEVGVYKADDFDEWALEIKVKFREEESLQILDEHRQSGGERSVSTIFFLMALQSLAVAPFRVVDEINQGMDPRNERMVHERMVEIACEEHTSQYFLITPKLLPNLKYDPRMRILCIASGEYMPENHEMVSVKKALAIRKALIAAG